MTAQYDWRAVHGHTIRVADWMGEMRARKSWYSWKQARIDSGTWTPEESRRWRLDICRIRSCLAVRVIDTTL